MISSASNEKIKHVAKLVKSASGRRSEGVFVVEGERICAEIPKERFVEGYVSESFVKKMECSGKVSFGTGHDHNPGGDSEDNVYPISSDGQVTFKGLPFVIVSDQVYKKMSDTVSGQGILAVVRQLKKDPVDFVDDFEDGDIKLLILENIQDPGNLGTMIRTAEAAGFDGIITDRNTVDVYNPKVIRSTMGGIFRMPVMAADDLIELIDDLRIREIKLYGAILDGSVDYREADYGKRLAILIGNEGNGLSKEARALVDTRVRIPMQGQVESLNAAVAAAILMYEANK